MHKILNKYIPILFTVMLVLMISGIVAAETPGHLVVIDAAHGGEESGAVGIDQVAEKDLTLAIARAVQKELSRENGLNVILTRDSDKAVSFDQRKKKIADAKPDLVLSIHANAGFAKTAAGYELYYPGFKKEDDRLKTSKNASSGQESKYLNDTVKFARLVQKNLDILFPRKGRGLREATVPLSEGLNAAVLVVEVGFVTNPDDKKKIASEKTQMEIAKALAKSIKSFF